MNDQLIYNVTSIISTILIIGTVIGGFLATRNGVLKASSEIQKNAGDYQAQAITALQAEIALLRAKYDDLHNENVKLQQTITTICEALKMRDIVISIDGTMVNIKDNGTSTTTRIHENKQYGGVKGILELFDSDTQQFNQMGFISQVNRAPGASTSQILRKPGSNSILFKNPRTQVISESDLPYQTAHEVEMEQKI